MGGGDSESEQSIDPRLMDLYEQNYGFAQDIVNQPYTPFTGDKIAGFNPDQLAQFQGARGLGMGGMGLAGQGLNTMSNIQSGNIGPQISGLMNPYTNQVIDRSMNDLERQRQVQTNSIGDQAVAANAFGGSRHGVTESLTNEAALRAGGDMSAGLRKSGYDQALSTLMNAGNNSVSLGLGAAAPWAQAGMQQQQLQQAGLDQNYQDFIEARDWDLRNLDILGSSLSQIPVGSNVTQSGGGGSPLAGAAGGAASGYAMSGGNPWGAAAGGVVGLLGSQ